MRRLAGTLVAVAPDRVSCRTGSRASPSSRVSAAPRSMCAQLPVPLDRAGAVPGSLNLHVERLKSRGTRQGALIALAGGPGQAATPYLIDWAGTFFAGWRNRDLVVFDQRGTGLSGVLRCPQLRVPVTRTPVGEAERAAACAQTLGAKRAFYTTRDSVDDIEAVRQALGVEKIALFGVSYGTKVALAYAAKYPQRVERLRARLGRRADRPGRLLPGEHRRRSRGCCARCARRTARTSRRTPSRTSPPRAAHPHAGLPVRAAWCRPRAGPTAPGSAACGCSTCSSRATSTRRCARTSRLPCAPPSTGDPAPLLRLALRADRGCGPGSVRVPQRRAVRRHRLRGRTAAVGPHDAPGRARWHSAEAALRAIPAAALTPFDRTTVLFASPTLQLCSRWPSAPAAPALQDGPFPAAPTLVLSGEDDLRTPLESARRIAARIPGRDADHRCPRWAIRCSSGFPRSCGAAGRGRLLRRPAAAPVPAAAA